MKKFDWQLRISLIFVAVSVILYIVHYLIFQNFHFLSEYTLFYFAFLPLEVIFVTLVLDQLMQIREMQERLEKLNMVIGVFFSEVGNRLLKELSSYLVVCDDLRNELRITGQWKEPDFQRALAYLQSHDPQIDCEGADKQQLEAFLVSKRSFLVGLLENQNLLEHEQFTDLLWAVFHLVEELDARETLTGMPASDLDHLSGDIKRAFGYLSREWIFYMKHLKDDYPYLFSLAVRLNPMLDHPDPHVY